jgi:carnitine O-acetyltransferase
MELVIYLQFIVTIHYQLVIFSQTEDIDLRVLEFTDFGKDVPKVNKLSPDSFIQIAFQLAYFRFVRISCRFCVDLVFYRLHNSLPPTYETGTLRRFYLGRTDTVNECHLQC